MSIFGLRLWPLPSRPELGGRQTSESVAQMVKTVAPSVEAATGHPLDLSRIGVRVSSPLDGLRDSFTGSSFATNLLGLYQHNPRTGTGTLTIHKDLSQYALPEVVAHELTHAVQFQNLCPLGTPDRQTLEGDATYTGRKVARGLFPNLPRLNVAPDYEQAFNQVSTIMARPDGRQRIDDMLRGPVPIWSPSYSKQWAPPIPTNVPQLTPTTPTITSYVPQLFDVMGRPTANTFGWRLLDRL